MALSGQALMQDGEPRKRFDGPSRIYRIGAASGRVLLFAPFVALGASFLLLLGKGTRPAMLWMLRENHPVEVATFALSFAGSLAGLRLARTLRERGEKLLVYGFYAVFSLGLFAIAMEEIAWGQKLLGFQTPAWLKPINRQGETTLHNIGALQGRSEWLRLVFGLAGIAGVLVSRRPRLARIAAPAILLPWFLLITAHAAVDAYNDVFPIQDWFDFTMQRTSEVVELLIAAAALLYVLLNSRRFRFGTWPEDPAGDAL